MLADGYVTYSSRRFKTNIQTLPDALSTVEKLRGVSYTLKATSKHEIGVIAEEVGAVVPQVVEYEDNGKDAKGVEYARLTALLIEATKQQQADIASALREIKSLRETDTLRETRTQREIKSEQATIRKQAATIAALKSDIRDGAENLKQVKQQLASHQSPAPTPIAAR